MSRLDLGGRTRQIIAVGLVAVGLAACSGGGDQITIPAQQWGSTIVRIETHPNPPVAGMSEIVVIATGPHGKPIGDMTVSLQGDPSMPWVQAIEDGFIGVYRRAIDLGNGQQATVRVRLQQGENEKTLLFPVKLAADGN